MRSMKKMTSRPSAKSMPTIKGMMMMKMMMMLGSQMSGKGMKGHNMKGSQQSDQIIVAHKVEAQQSNAGRGKNMNNVDFQYFGV